MKIDFLKSGIPVSPLLNYLENEHKGTSRVVYKKARLITISTCSIAVAVAISCIAKILVWLINIVTNIAFYGSLSIDFRSPANNHLGIWVIVIPAIGGLLVGLMALYGSKAIRGHGIPEAMEQILINQSKIRPSITFLKPISSAIAIGTGGPFGAEGPIIATGGALGSTIGQLFKITPNERKIILAAGATAGMAAIFGTPIAAIFLAIELLLFEFSPKAILPVALACITGAAGHHLLFEAGPVFPVPNLQTPSNMALAVYSVVGLIIGFISIVITKGVYVVEDWFERLPINWIWWPALGGLCVGAIGYFFPHTLGVGYDNITNLLSGKVTLGLILGLCIFKFLSWVVALGSGTSGGTLAPLLTIGGAAGALMGFIISSLFPSLNISISMAALVGMSAMFAGASRAYLTSVTFALEATMQSHALLPLLGACTASYLVSFFLMENTIMTEKIARRGVVTPDEYEPDALQKVVVESVIKKENTCFNVEETISNVKEWLSANYFEGDYLLVVNNAGDHLGILNLIDLYRIKDTDGLTIKHIIRPHTNFIKASDNLRKAVNKMSAMGVDVLTVLNHNKIAGVLSYRDVIKSYKQHHDENENASTQISLKRKRLKMLLKRRNFANGIANVKK